MEDSNCVKEGDNVIFKRNGACRAFQIRKNRQVFFERNKFSVDELLGQEYGSTFEIDKGKLVKIVKKKSTDFDSNVQDPSSDNRDLQDVDSNQKMSKDDIMKMKEEGITGEKIIEELVEHSETFKTKTEFSQAKYLKKKKSKHIISFTVLRPTPRLVLNIFAKEPQKICNLRADTLSQMLSFSNIKCGSHVAVVETCHGLVVSCVLQRLGGQGKLIQLIPNSSNQVYRQVMDYFGFSKEELNNVYSFPMSILTDLKQNHNITLDTSCDEPKEDDDLSHAKRIALDKECVDAIIDSEIKREVHTVQGVISTEDKTHCDTDGTNPKDETDADTEEGKAEETSEKDGTEADSAEGSKPFVPNKDLQRRRKAIRHKEIAELILSKKIDSFIVASKYNPVPIVKNMLEFLPPSKSVVVFCQFMEPLVEIYTHIKDHHLGLQVKLSETWLREYQVLPQRTHPMMNMSGNGGYLLTFTTCDPT